MNLIPLIGRNLKDPEIIDLLEHFEASVVYDFDRHFENMPDRYWAHLYDEGLLLRFDEAQLLDTIFVYLTPVEGFSPNSGDSLDFPLFRNKAAARAFAKENQLPFTQNRDTPDVPLWIRIEQQSCFVHYQFSGDGLTMVTLMSRSSAP